MTSFPQAIGIDGYMLPYQHKTTKFPYKMIKPYIKTVTFADIWAFRPEEPATHTAVPLINTVAAVEETTGTIIREKYK